MRALYRQAGRGSRAAASPMAPACLWRYVAPMHGAGKRTRAPAHTRSGPPPCALFALISLVLTIGCGPDAAELRAADPRPNVLLVSLDTTRSDHLSVYGYERETSPHLMALASQGVRFDAAYAPSASTGPSHASLFTSLYPMTHRVIKNGRRLGDGFETLAEILRDSGYTTGGVVSSFVLSRRFGYGQGFEAFDDDFSRANVPSGTTLWEGREIEGKFWASADDTTRRAIEWLDDRRAAERPFFLFVHYFDPHEHHLLPSGYRPPFEPGPKEALKLNRQIFRYDTQISFMDREIGRLLTALAERGLDRDSLIVVAGDHGEGLMQHGHMFHGAQIYEEDVRVPLILRWLGELAGPRVLVGPMELMDLAPTLLELIGVTGGEDLRGRSLAKLLRGESKPEVERSIHLYRRHYAPRLDDEANREPGLTPGIEPKGEKFGLRVGHWKLIEGPDEGSLELYDLESDPGEHVDLAQREPERVETLRGMLAAWRSEHTHADLDVTGPSEEERARLEALGYGE